MKLPKTTLKRLIKEEISKVLKENKASQCKHTTLLLESKISINEYKTHLRYLEKELTFLLEQGDQNKIQQWFETNVFTKVGTFAQKVSQNLQKLPSGILNVVVNGLKGILSIVSKFKTRFPKLFKITLVLALGIAILLFIGVGSAYAAAGGDPAAMGYSPAQLDAMVGLLEILHDELVKNRVATSIDIGEARVYLQDLKDGKLDIKDYSNTARELAARTETLFRGLMQDTNNPDTQVANTALETLLDALEKGKQAVGKLNFGPVKIGPTGGIGI
jgi:hypothetical protein